MDMLYPVLGLVVVELPGYGEFFLPYRVLKFSTLAIAVEAVCFDSFHDDIFMGLIYEYRH